MPSTQKTKSSKATTRSNAKGAPRPAAARESADQPKLLGSLGKYVYCIIQTTEPRRFGPIGIGAAPAEVHTVNFKDIAAVVSDTPLKVVNASRENVLAHERVSETVIRYYTGDFAFIPMSFGTVFKTPEDVVELLRGAYDAFRDVLGKLHDRFEFGLKVMWDRDVVIRELERDDEDIRRLKEISSKKARVQYRRLVDQALQARSERYVNDIFSELRDVCVASRANKPVGDKMIMNAAFLVVGDGLAAFEAKVKAIAGAKFDKLTFRHTGPWPPYNFVNIRVKLVTAKEPE